MVSFAPSPTPGLFAEATPAAEAFASATFSAQGPPEKWKTLIPVNIRPSEQRVAQPTVWSVMLRVRVARETASIVAFAASMRESWAGVRGMAEYVRLVRRSSFLSVECCELSKLCFGDQDER